MWEDVCGQWLHCCLRLLCVLTSYHSRRSNTTQIFATFEYICLCNVHSSSSNMHRLTNTVQKYNMINILNQSSTSVAWWIPLTFISSSTRVCTSTIHQILYPRIGGEVAVHGTHSGIGSLIACFFFDHGLSRGLNAGISWAVSVGHRIWNCVTKVIITNKNSLSNDVNTCSQLMYATDPIFCGSTSSRNGTIIASAHSYGVG